ncbi:MAG: hypothetical protein ABNH53_08560 [Henriciella sp.]
MIKKKPSGFAGGILFKVGANPEGSSYLGTGEHPSRTGYSPQVIDNGGSSLISYWTNRDRGAAEGMLAAAQF